MTFPPVEHLQGCFTREDVKVAINSLNPDSSPGYPFAVLAKDKSELVEVHEEWLIDCVLDRLGLLGKCDLRHVPEAQDPVWLVEAGLADPLRLFIKNEPHPIQKVEDGRLRLIMSGSVIHELCERVIFGRQNEAEILAWANIPSKPGMGLGSDDQAEVLQAYVDLVSSKRKNLRSSDVSGWDFCVTEEMLMEDANRRIRLADAALTKWATIARNLMFVLARSVFVLSDGRAFAQTLAGIMKSGVYVTSSTNSFCRNLASRVVGAKWSFAMGDDCVEDGVEDAAERYKEYGVRLTGNKPGPDFEFCSHMFYEGDNKAYPLNGSKSLYRLLSNREITAELLVQFKHEYRHDPKLDYYLEIVSSCYGCPSWVGEEQVAVIKDQPLNYVDIKRIDEVKRRCLGL